MRLKMFRSKVNNVNLLRLVVTLSVPSLTCGPGRGAQDGDRGWKLPSSLRRNCTRQARPALPRTWPRPRGSQAPARSAPPAPPSRPHPCIQSTVIQHWTSFILLFSGTINLLSRNFHYLFAQIQLKLFHFQLRLSNIRLQNCGTKKII